MFLQRGCGCRAQLFADADCENLCASPEIPVAKHGDQNWQLFHNLRQRQRQQ